MCGRTGEGDEYTRPYCRSCHAELYRHLGGEKAPVLEARLRRMTRRGTHKDRAAVEWGLAELDRARAQRDAERGMLIREVEVVVVSAKALGITDPVQAAAFEVAATTAKSMTIAKLTGNTEEATNVARDLKRRLDRLLHED